jgi:multiple sugar transport system substrate-binding protein
MDLLRSVKSILPLSMVLMLFGCQPGTIAGPEVYLEEQPVVIQFWTPFTGGDESFMDQLVQRYNRENEDRIKVELKQYKSDEYYNKLITSIVTEAAPDVAIVHSSKYSQFIPARFFMDIDALALEAEVKWEDYNPNILASTMINNMHYGIPLDTHFLVMYYNKRLLGDAGLLNEQELPDITLGEDGFIRFLRSLRESLPEDVAALAFPDSRTDPLWLWWSLYNQLLESEGRLIDTLEQGSNINNQPALRVMTFMDSLMKQGFIAPNIENQLNQFTEGKAATLLWGIWSVGLLEQTEGMDFGIIPLPLIYDQPAVWGDSHTFAFPLQEKQDPLKSVGAVKFANWIANHGEAWAQAGHVPASMKVTESEFYSSLPHRSMYSPYADNVKYFPNFSGMSQIIAAMTKEFELMMSGRQSPEQLLEQFHKVIESQIKESGI